MAMSTAPPPSSPSHSSPESFEVEDDSNPTSSAHWQMHGQTSPGANTSSSSQPPRIPTPMQKRRRVTRACDECRRKKIKCDGKQPCTHCTVYGYGCTYDQPSSRRRHPSPQYIEDLEHRLQRAESLLRTILPNADLKHPNLGSVIQQQARAGNGNGLSQANISSCTEARKDQGLEASDQDGQLQSMIETTGQLDLDERGHWDFHGGSSGIVFLKRMCEQFGGLLGSEPSVPFLPRSARLTSFSPMFDSPRSSAESPLESGLPNTIDLPPRETARSLCSSSINCACALLRFIHLPTFYEMFDRIYDIPAENYGDEENRFLPLLYVVLALGSMFTTDPLERDEPEQAVYKTGIDQGLKYFRSARQMMDITDCRDITSLQAILFMILFLQSSANLSTCYSYIGIALRSSLRMGLHRNLTGNFSPIERETRRRAFWIVRKMDTYVSALLGFPQMLSSDDIDQELPIEVDDEYITKDAVLEMPPGRLSLYSASNAHTRLMAILAKVIKYIYPIKGLEQIIQGSTSTSYVISHAKIREVERDLQEWLEKLPVALRPGGDGPPEVLRVQQLLRLAYAHVQMMLYRPFLHYVSQKSCAGKTIDKRSYACAAACVSVSRNIVHITAEMKRRGLLIGAYWFTMYTTFFAILSLVFFVLENPDKAESPEILADANAGKDALKGLATRSMAADRCAHSLEGLFEQLPERLKRSRPAPTAAKKKRSAPEPNLSGPRGVHSSPDISQPIPGLSAGMISRATTFPTPPPINTAGIPQQNITLDSTRFQTNTMSDPNLRQSFHELISPADLSATGTPDSSSAGNSLHQPQFNLQQFGSSNGLPDFSAMMFPSADPFAYPNQPMIEFDSRQQKSENFENILDNSRVSPIFLQNGAGGRGLYDDLEGQLFGPLPPYLMQGQQILDLPTQMDTGQCLMSGLNPQDLNSHTGMTPNGGMNFDEIFSGNNDGWNSMLMEQGLR